MTRKLLNMMLLSVILLGSIFAGCGDGKEEQGDTGVSADRNETENGVSELAGGIAPSGGEIFDDTEIVVFADESLSPLLKEIITKYKELRPTVSVEEYYDNAQAIGALAKEGAACDIVFLAEIGQLDMLKEAERLVENTGYYVAVSDAGQVECLQADGNFSSGAAETVYAFSQLANEEADELERDAAYDFVQFLISDTAKELYGK